MKKAFLLFLLLISFFTIKIAAQQAGSLDTTFGVGGKVLLNVPGGSSAIALQADGKIVVAGAHLVGRLNTDGSLDTSFNHVGWDTISAVDFSDVAIQSDGKIVAVGTGAARFMVDGSLDTTFGVGGIANFNYCGVPKFVIQPNGKLIILNKTTTTCEGGFFLTRLNSNGAVDLFFGTSGYVSTIPFGNEDCSAGYDLLLQSDGKIIVVGYFLDCPPGTNIVWGAPAILRYNDNGHLDTTFGQGGLIGASALQWMEIPQYNFVALTSSGNLALSYLSTWGAYWSLEVVTFFDNGLPDDYGNAVLDTTMYPQDLAAQSDKKIVAVCIPFNRSDFGLIRCHNGLDSSFGTGGIVITDFGSNSEQANSLVIQPDGKIVVVGYSGSNLALARYLNCGGTYSTSSPCNATCNGSISIATTFGVSPFNYLWSTGETSSTIDSLCAGTYSVTMSDSNGCISNYNITLSVPNATAQSSPTLCYGTCSGTATATLSGGTLPFTYLWSNGDTTDTSFNLCGGIHSVIIEDAHQCTDSVNVTVNEAAPISVTTFARHNPTCIGCSDGYFVLNISGGVLPYTITWLPPNGNLVGHSFLNLPAAAYTFTFTDALGCTVSYNDTLTDQPDWIRNAISENWFEISPNPAHDQFTISLPTGQAGTLKFTVATLEINNVLGEKVYTAQLANRESCIVHRALPSGIYFVKVQTEQGSAVKKLIIQ